MARTGEVLAAFETEVAAFADPSDDEEAYETDERENLCAYIDATLTDEWREW